MICLVHGGFRGGTPSPRTENLRPRAIRFGSFALPEGMHPDDLPNDPEALERTLLAQVAKAKELEASHTALAAQHAKAIASRAELAVQHAEAIATRDELAARHGGC